MNGGSSVIKRACIHPLETGNITNRMCCSCGRMLERGWLMANWTLWNTCGISGLCKIT